MKKMAVIIVATIILTSCGGSEDKKSVETQNGTTENKVSTTDIATAENKTSSISARQDYEKGLDLISKSDCVTCHSVGEKMIGPSYSDIAKKYAGKPGIEDVLAQKIIKGGSGNWGEVIMMPHPNLSAEDAKVMVNYIMSVNDQ